jgi:hypothetical protein|tara:strand:+ start:420 stop:578 length:159 start_codon:yes stop_codon:yes gene_type:complete
MSNANWHKEKPFVDWLVSARYAKKTKKGIEPIIGLGLVLYCFEAYCVGKGQK